MAGLVAITPASGYVDASSAIIIGFVAGAVCYGAILTGVFAVAAVNGASGLVEGNASQLGKQLVAVAATWIYSGIATFIILKVVDRFVGLRVGVSEEEEGLDASQHGEVAWQF